MTRSGAEVRPDLTLSRWEATRHTLHMWTQIVNAEAAHRQLEVAPAVNGKDL